MQAEEPQPAVVGQMCILREKGGERSETTPQKVTHRVPGSPNHLDAHPREMKTCSKKKKKTLVYKCSCSPLHDSPKVATTQMSIHYWRDK